MIPLLTAQEMRDLEHVAIRDWGVPSLVLQEHAALGALALLPAAEPLQVLADFEYIGGAGGLSCLAVYGGAPMGPQESQLRRGVDVVVGTPGRIKDHLERGTLNLSKLR